MKGHAHQHTIYSYKLLYRFRWGLIGYLLQLVLIGLSLIGSSMLLQVPVASLVVTLAILPVVPICHLFIFRLYARLRSQKPRTTADMLVSPWWGAGYLLPVPLSVYRASECTVLFGSVFIAAGAYVWLSADYGLTLLGGVVIVALPRLIALLASFRHPSESRVKYENRGIAFLKTDG
ncbi:hypothetical protein ACEF06_06680 [Brevibacillus agri]|uniref:hypothetical protein n=1 Tax=Brevibacillus agri TaxID=51101 RepID=UPI001C8E80F3|nr:hypothetical protein [Brevibacillus agri]MBY0052399.1 hypothetical protein [Brevibacillus agri]MED3497614.1 hypothetical protein [Brevibacillus agri]